MPPTATAVVIGRETTISPLRPNTIPIIEDAEVVVESTREWVEDRESGRRISAWVTSVGDDLVIAVGGGQQPHVGCVVLAQPQPARSGERKWSASCSVLTIPPHKEEPIARVVATRVAEASGRVTVVTAGVHDDDLDAAGIAVYLRLGEELAEKLSTHLTEASR
jgi:hypothetical protein